MKYFRFEFIFYEKIATPRKRSLPLSHKTPSKSWGPVKPPPPFEILVGRSTPLPPAERGWGWVHTNLVFKLVITCSKSTMETAEQLAKYVKS